MTESPMDSESERTGERESWRPAPSGPPAALSWPVRLAFLYAGVILPVSCHLLTLTGPPDAANWQSGALHDKLSFTLSVRAGLAMFPLMLYPIVCLVLLLVNERRFALRPWVRFGILTGVPVAAWYSLLLGAVVVDVPGALSPAWLGVGFLGLVAWGSALGLWVLWRVIAWKSNWLRRAALPIVVGSVLLYLAGCLLVALGNGRLADAMAWPLAFIAAFCFFSLLFAPFWALGVYLVMSYRLFASRAAPFRFGMLTLLAVVSWLGAFLAACRFAVVRALEEYAQLPVQPPGDCYVASAAAYGHSGFVQSETVPAADGSPVRVNRQLRVLKAGEVALRAVAPGLHRGLRRGYDFAAPPVARRLRNAYLADAAYVLLKPAEWATAAVLAGLLGVEGRRIAEIFRPAP